MRVVWMALFLGVAAAAAVGAGCSSDTPASGMTITVQKWDAVNQCFATIAGDPLPWLSPSDAGTAEGTQACPAGSPNLTALVDQIRMVIGFGDLQFGASTSRPSPTVTMTLDGVPTPSGASIAVAQVANPTVFFATFTAPGRAVNEMDLSASVTTGFEHLPVGPLHVSGPTVNVSVSQCNADAGGCSGILAGIGFVTVAVSAPGTAPTSGTITWTLNGIPQAGSIPINLTPAPNTVNTITGVAFVPVPASPGGTQWVLTAQVGAGSGSGPSVTLATPVIGVAVDQCHPDAGICALTADVGTVAVLVTAPGIVSATAPVSGTVTTMLDGVPQQGSFPVALAGAPNLTNVLTGTAYIPVPAAHDGAIWSLGAQVGSASGATPATILLHAPQVVSTFSGCVPSTPCTVAAGAMVSFTVSVPLGMYAQQATVSTMVGNTIGIGSLTVNLSTSDINANTISGTATLSAPTQSGATWLINANVAGYQASTIEATIQ